MRAVKHIVQRTLSLVLLGMSLSLMAAVDGGMASPKSVIKELTDELKNDKTCEGTGGTLAYAETKDYSLYVCADSKEISQPRHYRSVNKNGTKGVSLTAKTYNPDQGNYLEFYNGDYIYMLQLPSANIKNPALVVEFPDGSGYEQQFVKFLINPVLLNRETRSPISIK